MADWNTKGTICYKRYLSQKGQKALIVKAQGTGGSQFDYLTAASHNTLMSIISNAQLHTHIECFAGRSAYLVDTRRY